MLIASPRHTPSDLEHWATLERQDRAHATMLQPRIDEALLELERFLAAGPAYIGVSWGKDSVVVADLACRDGLRLPLIWIEEERIASPECSEVRDAFLAIHPDAEYLEISVQQDESGARKLAGFARAAQLAGTDRYISGIRAEESATRELRVRRWGASTERTCAPIARWTAGDVFGYLYLMRLPVHPAYAMTMGGRLDRGRIRVSSVGRSSAATLRGAGRGRLEWESVYYPDLSSLVTPGKEVTPADSA